MAKYDCHHDGSTVDMFQVGTYKLSGNKSMPDAICILDMLKISTDFVASVHL